MFARAAQRLTAVRQHLPINRGMLYGVAAGCWAGVTTNVLLEPFHDIEPSYRLRYAIDNGLPEPLTGTPIYFPCLVGVWFGAAFHTAAAMGVVIQRNHPDIHQRYCEEKEKKFSTIREHGSRFKNWCMTVGKPPAVKQQITTDEPFLQREEPFEE